MSRIQDLLAIIRNQPDHKVVMALDELLPRWIQVGEQLPEEGVEVLAYSPSVGRQVAHTVAVDGGVAWYWGTSGVLGIDATHWMPMLEPPLRS